MIRASQYYLQKSSVYFWLNINLIVLGLIAGGIILGDFVLCIDCKSDCATLPTTMKSTYGVWPFVVGGIVLIAYLNWLIYCYSMKDRENRG